MASRRRQPTITTTAAGRVTLDWSPTSRAGAYEAAYLDLASFRGVPLATIDDPLRQAAEKAGVELAD